MALPASTSSGASSSLSEARSRRIFGAGEMADLVRAFDWSATTLGSIDSWQDPLLTCVNLLLSSRHPMFLWWGPDHIQFYNDAYRPSFDKGKHPGALGQQARECWAEIWDLVESRINLVTRQGEATWYENQCVPILRNGRLEEVYWTWSDSPVRDTEGNIVGVLVTCSETTDRVLAERELSRSRERLELTLESADLGTWSYDASTDLSTGDAAMQRIFGSPRASGDFDYWITFVHPEDRDHVRTEFVAALSGQAPYESEYRIVRPDGSTRWVHTKGRVLIDPNSPVRLFVIVEDITERKLAEIELHNRACDLRESQRIGKMGSWNLDLATGQVSWSEEVYRLMEHDPTLPVINYAEHPEIMEPDSLHHLEAAVAQCIATGQSYELDTKMYLPSSGRVIWFSTRGEPIFDSEGKIFELRGTVRDITDRKLAEEALRDSEERLRLALAAARDMGSFDWDILSDRCFADPRFCAIFGLDPERGKQGLPMADALANVYPEDWPEVERLARHTMDTGEDFVMDYRIQTTPSTLRWITARGNCLRTEDGTPVRFTGVVLDITERKLAEQALLRTEKLAAVGRLASSIAHEINNPLESITNLLYLARATEDLDQSREYLNLADTELRRASAITTQTLRFHKQSTRPTEVTCEDLIGSALHILRSRLVNAKITVEKRKRANRPVLCFDGEIRQVVSNILINAVDAMHPKGGRLITRSREGHDPASQRPGLILTIADTGSGMSAETLAKAFEPFYTTKGVAGTGLGLWISKEIIERHKGRLKVRSSQRAGSSGTVFTIFLPFEAAAR